MNYTTMKQVNYSPHSGNDFEYDQVLPCPFCGEIPIVKFIGNNYTKSRKVEIKCSGCRATMINATLRHDAEWIAKISIDNWNKRT
jgi:formate dehydrogenase maturation protein FdhE